MAYNAYITASYYTDSYQGVDIDASKFYRFALRASGEIDALTFSRIRKATGAEISGYDTYTQEAIQQATCVITEALALIDTATGGAGAITTAESVNGTSYTIDAESVKQLLPDARAKARSILLPTGLLYAGI
jgi:hypothetical protein